MVRAARGRRVQYIISAFGIRIAGRKKACAQSERFQDFHWFSSLEFWFEIRTDPFMENTRIARYEAIRANERNLPAVFRSPLSTV